MRSAVAAKDVSSRHVAAHLFGEVANVEVATRVGVDVPEVRSDVLVLLQVADDAAAALARGHEDGAGIHVDVHFVLLGNHDVAGE